jgi:dolichol-phosphate mannosyltransferase
VLFIDDGSTDDTFTRLTALSQTRGCPGDPPRAQSRPGAAMRTGYAHAQGDIHRDHRQRRDVPFTEYPQDTALLTPGCGHCGGVAYHPQGGMQGVPLYG